MDQGVQRAVRTLADVLQDFRALKNESPDDEWQENVKEIVTGTEFLAATAPEIEAPLPDDPRHDSEREYVQNVIRIDRHREGDGGE